MVPPESVNRRGKSTIYDGPTRERESSGEMIAVRIDGASLPTTHTCCVAEIEMLDSLPECRDADNTRDSDEFYSEVGNACPGEEFTLTSALGMKGEPRTSATVDFDIVRRQISMFKVRPLLPEINTKWMKPRFPCLTASDDLGEREVRLMTPSKGSMSTIVLSHIGARGLRTWRLVSAPETYRCGLSSFRSMKHTRLDRVVCPWGSTKARKN
jgi:hypothetical protein